MAHFSSLPMDGKQDQPLPKLINKCEGSIFNEWLTYIIWMIQINIINSHTPRCYLLLKPRTYQETVRYSVNHSYKEGEVTYISTQSVITLCLVRLLIIALINCFVQHKHRLIRKNKKYNRNSLLWSHCNWVEHVLIGRFPFNRGEIVQQSIFWDQN